MPRVLEPKNSFPFFFPTSFAKLTFCSIYFCSYSFSFLFSCYLFFHVCGMYACFCMCTDACVCEVDAGNHTLSLFHHIHWVKVFESSTVLKDTACLTSQLALRNPHFYLPRLELNADHSTQPTFMWVSWDPNSGLQTTCFNLYTFFLNGGSFLPGL